MAEYFVVHRGPDDRDAGGNYFRMRIVEGPYADQDEAWQVARDMEAQANDYTNFHVLSEASIERGRTNGIDIDW